ncbi:MAG: penicillin acylase family protein [Devosia sp.]
MDFGLRSRLRQRTSLAFSLAGLAGSVVRRTATRRFPDLDVSARLKMLPRTAPGLEQSLTIRWNAHHVPFVEASSDRDGAVGLGMVHGHLRLAQLELMRRAAAGRLSEVAGSAAVELDHLLRLIDFPRATEASLALLPEATRAFVDGFGEGLSAIALSSPPPPEFEIFGIAPAPFTAEDLFAISRLCSADYSWKVWRTLHKLRDEPDFAEMWADLVGVTAVADEDIPFGAEALEKGVATTFTRTGSNAYAVSGTRTLSGKPLLAADPHLMITAPNPWMVVGLKTPSIKVWGLTIPGLPIFGVGRNAHGAWGGTNLHATSSELVDVAGEDVSERTVAIPVRGKSDTPVTVRETRFGPVVSDGKPFEMPSDTVSLHWLGHMPSDEFTPFLSILTATNWEEFSGALDGYGLPGLNMIWADAGDTNGHIGKLVAAKIPSRPLATPEDFVVAPDEAHAQWQELFSAARLPMEVDPPSGFVASANEAPVDPPVTISLFFAAPDRIDRLNHILSNATDLTLEDLRILQLDTFLQAGAHMRDTLVAAADDAGHEGAVLEALRAWDGRYEEASEGALAFELVAAHLVEALEARADVVKATPYWRPFTRLVRLVEDAAPADLQEVLGEALREAQGPLHKHRTWGGIHRIKLSHPLARLPWLKTRLPTLDFPTGGSKDTLMKSMHPFTKSVHASTFGANARFLADLADEDGTYAVLLGGQDGWPGSRSMFDMVGAWRRGESLRLPFSEDGLNEDFPIRTTVEPGHA